MTTFAAQVAIALSLLPSSTASQSPSILRTSSDAIAVSSDRFKLFLENAHVRVIEYVLQPGERDQGHTHPPQVSFVVSGGTAHHNR